MCLNLFENDNHIDSETVYEDLLNLGILHCKLKQHKIALHFLQYAKKFAVNHTLKLFKLFTYIFESLLMESKVSEAKSILQECESILTKNKIKRDNLLMAQFFLMNFDLAESENQNLENALKYLELYFDVIKHNFGFENIRTVKYFKSKARIFFKLKDYDQSFRYLEVADELIFKIRSTEDIERKEILDNMADISIKKSDLESARTFLTKSQEIYENIYGKDTPESIIYLLKLSKINDDKNFKLKCHERFEIFLLNSDQNDIKFAECIDLIDLSMLDSKSKKENIIPLQKMSIQIKRKIEIQEDLNKAANYEKIFRISSVYKDIFASNWLIDASNAIKQNINKKF